MSISMSVCAIHLNKWARRSDVSARRLSIFLIKQHRRIQHLDDEYIEWPYSFFSMIFLLSLFVSVENIAWVMRSRSHTLVLCIHIYEKKTIINTRENKASSNIRPRPWTKVSISKRGEKRGREKARERDGASKGEEIQNLHIYNRLVRLTRSPPFIMIINSVL